MSALRAVVERTIARIKGDPAYRLDPEYSVGQLLAIVWYRAAQWGRGAMLRLRAPALERPVFRGRRVVVEFASNVRSGPGLILEDGAFINAMSREGVTLGRNVTIGRGAQVICTGVIAQMGVGVRIGDRSAVGAGSFLGGQGGIVVGNDVIMGPGVRIFSENHAFDDVSIPIRAQGVERKGVEVGDDCWIGAGATIVDGVRVGHGCVIGAGSVVTRDVPAYAVIAGSPARVISFRGRASPFDGPPAAPPAPTDSQAKSPSLPGTESGVSPARP